MKFHPYSISKLGTYNQCPYKFKLQYIDKVKVPFETNKALIKGKVIHSILEENFNYNFTPELSDVYNIEDHKESINILKNFENSELGSKIKKFISLGNLEEDFAFTFDKKLIGYWDKNAELRGSADGYLVNGNKATIIDYKSGKDHSKDGLYSTDFGIDQAKMYALYVFIKFPEVQEVKALFVFVEHSTSRSYNFVREDVNNFINYFTKSIQTIENDTQYRKVISPLCDYCNFYKHNYCNKETPPMKINIGLDF